MIYVEPYERNGRIVRGHWKRTRSDGAKATATKRAKGEMPPAATAAAYARAARNSQDLFRLVNGQASRLAAPRPAPEPTVTPDGARSASKAIYWDMDGTIADLYGVEDWEPKLRAYDASPYAEARPLVDMARLRDDMAALREAGWHIGVVSALSKCPTPEYDRKVMAAKLQWLSKNLPDIDEVSFVAYGTKKHTAVMHAHDAILVDDEAGNRAQWADAKAGRIAIDARDAEAMMARIDALAEAAMRAA